MKLVDLLSVIQKDTDRIKIVSESHNILYIGYKGLLDFNDEELKESGLNPELEVKQIAYSHEVRDKKWKENGRTAPLEPQTIPDHIYLDLEERIYLYIRVANAA